MAAYVYLAAVPYTVIESVEIEPGHNHSLIITKEYGELTLCEIDGDSAYVLLDNGDVKVWDYIITVIPKVMSEAPPTNNPPV